MTIEEKDFRLTPVTEGAKCWDLELLYTIQPKGKESRQEFKTAGYGLTLESAINRIANFRISQKHKDEALTMREYLIEFKKAIEDLQRTCYEEKKMVEDGLE